MDCLDNIEKENKIDIPKYLYIGDYKYSFKANLVNERYSYHCFHRTC